MMTISFRQVTLWALAMAFASQSFAQDPTKTLPEIYRVELDNDFVKVVRVHYDAGVKLPAHTHPAGGTAYIYLNDAAGIIFRHIGSMSHVTNRPPVKTGGIRINYGMEEQHEVENTSNSAADQLRIVFKTESGGARGGRKLSPTDNQFENAQLRITRLSVSPMQTLLVEAKEPTLVVEVPSGRQHWIDAGDSTAITSAGTQLDLVRIEFLTRPKQDTRLAP
jgi:hypothetical protein